ncbi:hypothetical protein BDF22DRAFT_666769 [Syncephalis plumigaleata]|nr:hypothetical protein BDF22DRAFT_666769 [Syncephalis plumigaleata]
MGNHRQLVYPNATPYFSVHGLLLFLLGHIICYNMLHYCHALFSVEMAHAFNHASTTRTVDTVVLPARMSRSSVSSPAVKQNDH